jgi:hypothetical protein
VWGGGLRVCRGKGAIEGSGETILSGRGLDNLLSTAVEVASTGGRDRDADGRRPTEGVAGFLLSNQRCALQCRPTAHPQIVKIGRGNFVREGA